MKKDKTLVKITDEFAEKLKLEFGLECLGQTKTFSGWCYTTYQYHIDNYNKLNNLKDE